ncbi:hypothetical protein [Methylomonas sp. LWB]|uniref:hypothetical protein n=1 Tax=Methylomonas sp. LWB TaxID=1905845 RepID=UPI0011152F56|nr:hypothetical protein [Methylomonas sp. LWB]
MYSEIAMDRRSSKGVRKWWRRLAAAVTGLGEADNKTAILQASGRGVGRLPPICRNPAPPRPWIADSASDGLSFAWIVDLAEAKAFVDVAPLVLPIDRQR